MLHITNTTKQNHKKALAGEVFVSLMLVALFSTSFAQASGITADNVIKLTNKARQAAGEAVLVKNEKLQQAAQNKAQDMFDNDYFAHVSPAGKSPWFWIDKAGYDYRFAGENLAINYTSAEDEQQAWMDSPLHRKNILNPAYEEIGVAVGQGIINGNRTTVAVQMFGTLVPDALVTSAVSAKPELKATVAGADSVSLVQENPAGKISNKAELSTLYSNNKPTLVGWFAAFGFALLIVAVDVAALVHKKHDQLFILKETRKRHA